MPDLRLAIALLAFTGASAPGQAAEDGPVATRPGTAETTTRSAVSDPCGFFRGQAYGRGLSHVATEMLWACEEIAARRAAGMTVSERLVAVELALDRYRAEVVAAGAAGFARGVTSSHYFGPGDAAKHRIAEDSGMLAALEAIRTGF